MQGGNSMDSRHKHTVTLVALFSVASLHGSAAAYLDPGTGSMILQAVLAGIAVVAVSVKMYWYKLVAFMKGQTLEPEEDWLKDLDLDSEETEDAKD